MLVILIRFLRSLVGNGPRIKIAFEGISEETLPLLRLAVHVEPLFLPFNVKFRTFATRTTLLSFGQGETSRRGRYKLYTRNRSRSSSNRLSSKHFSLSFFLLLLPFSIRGRNFPLISRDPENTDRYRCLLRLRLEWTEVFERRISWPPLGFRANIFSNG